MPEYIEKEAVLREIRELMEIFMNSKVISATLDFVKQSLEHLPAADVAPVVHGRWEKTFEDCDMCHRCSLCKKSALYNGNEEEVLSDYCPNCGAKMDLEVCENENT